MSVCTSRNFSHLAHVAEIEFPFAEITRFEELESDDFLLVDPRAMRSEYLSQLEAWRTRLKTEFREGRVKYMPLTTDESVDRVLYEWLSGTPT